MFQRLTIAAAFATYLLIVLGAVVRVTGSGLGCPDWPTCHGQLLPPLELTAIIEYNHRLVAALDSALILAVTGSAWFWYRRVRALIIPATLLPVALITQILLGAVTVLLELPPSIVVVHLTVALIILGLLVWMSVVAGERSAENESRTSVSQAVRSPINDLRHWSWAGLAAVFVLLMTGAYMRSQGAGWACAGFPACNGELLPFGANPLVDIHLTHRLVAYSASAVMLALLVQAWRAGPWLRPAIIGVGASLTFQLVVGIGAVSSGVPILLRGLHVAGAAAVWATTVLLASLITRARAEGLGQTDSGAALPARQISMQPPKDAPPARGYWALARAYLALTKPRIISLLLITTLASMMVAAHGMPAWGLVLATLVGGALSAGSANTFNCYLDRDIDQLMGRTSGRPIPAGVIQPWQALVFGFSLGLLSLLVLGVFANWLAAALSLAGLLYYVFVYTCWLKRSTPSNIVIGGAAGAVPPLVGWAAVTGEVSLLAVYLFAVIFFWTPPHFWALALLIRREYERARVPMLPIVRGEDETRHQILLYSVFLVAFTLLVVVFREVGLFYMVAALLLGGMFLYYAVILLREASAVAARRLFRYSIFYLALLFAAMVIDRWRVV